MAGCLGLIMVLACLSVYGAFIGAEKAKVFFNSPPLACFWLALTLCLAMGFFVYENFTRNTGMLLTHIGCFLILVGALAGSETGHKLQSKLFKIEKIPKAKMLIYEGTAEDQAILNDGSTRQLPFHIKLNDFRIEYYQPAYLYVQTQQGQSYKIPVEVGREFALDSELGSLNIIRVFENLRIVLENNQSKVIDDPRSGLNAALELEIINPDGTKTKKYVFERFRGHHQSDEKLIFSYRRTISDFVSDIEAIENGEVVAAKSVEVNHPFHFGGYHFYQSSYDDKAGRYTVLSLTSDTGLSTVYTGYLALCAGIFWYFGLRLVFEKIKLRTK